MFIQLTPLLGLFSGRLHQVSKQPKLSLTIYILQFFPHCFSEGFFLTHPVKFFPVGGNRRTRRKPTTSVVGGRRLDN